MRTRPLYDIVALLARAGVGIVFMAHGWQKIEVGITVTSKDLADSSVPVATATAIYATFVELLGGAALIAGLALPVAGVALFIDMAWAFIFIHADQGLLLVDGGRAAGGYELVMVLGLAGLLLAAGAGGRLTLDNRLFPRRSDGEEPWPPPDTPTVTSRHPARAAEPAEPAGKTASTGKTGSTGDTAGPARSAGSAGSTDTMGSAGSVSSTSGRTGPATRPDIQAPAPAGTPRLASEIVEDSEPDVLVAGRKRTRRPRRSSGSGGQPPRRAPDAPGGAGGAGADR